MKPSQKEEDSSNLQDSTSSPRPSQSALQQALAAGSLVIHMAISVIVAYYIGVWVDQKVGTHNLFSWGGLVLGGVGASAILFRLVKQVESKRM